MPERTSDGIAHMIFAINHLATFRLQMNIPKTFRIVYPRGQQPEDSDHPRFVEKRPVGAAFMPPVD